MSTGTYERFMNELHKPMKVRLSLVPRGGMDTLTCDILVHGEDEFDAEVNEALIKLLRASWYLAPGDVIRIDEV